MTSILASYPMNWLSGVGENHLLYKGRNYRFRFFGYSNLDYPCKEEMFFPQLSCPVTSCPSSRRFSAIFSGKLENGMDPDDSEDETDQGDSEEKEIGPVNSEILRKKLERIVGTDDSSFSGIDLATLIRNKFGRSYDVQLIKKEFMGRNLLALNVMWKYMEQRSFPLTEEEYILRLDDVANTLKCWGAVSHVRNSLEKLREKERPRIGKVNSVDMFCNLLF
ncbi:Hypothetical predicted protein [Olea europaea subsp. europaea]|uniref:Uncharacterized protein n=1 Tax=Olea europaea subsp. europaea TaxID=158383 RepID=A0A8S0QA68_OLEEU|nr:Hypothetical predicted protein [Olea europaea subsp. europaea]